MSSRSGWMLDLSGFAQAGPVWKRQRVVRAVVGERALPGPDVPQDPDVLAHPGERLGERLAIPALDDLRPGHAEAEDRPPAGEMVKRHRRHRGGRGRPCGDLHDCRPELDPLGLRAPPRERHQRVGAVRLGGPDRVKPEALGLLHGLERTGRRTAGPVAGVESQSKVARHRRSRTLLRSARYCVPRHRAVIRRHRPGGRGCSAEELRARGQAARLPRSHHAPRVGVAPAARVALRRDQHVLAQRREMLAAQRAAIGHGFDVLGPADGVPLRVEHPWKDRTARRSPAIVRLCGATRRTHHRRDESAPNRGRPPAPQGRLPESADRLPERIRASVPAAHRRRDQPRWTDRRPRNSASSSSSRSSTS